LSNPKSFLWKGVEKMIPHFQSESLNRRRAVNLLAALMLLALVAGIFLMAARGGVTASALILGGVSLSALILGMIAYAFATGNAEKSKPKREGEDMYTLIDRLVDDLDDDERAYLQKRLAERHDVKKDNLAQSVENLLDRRPQSRKP
jgi:hypothetical protein